MTDIDKSLEWRRGTFVPRLFELGGKPFKPCPGNLGKKRLAITEMAIRGCCTYTGKTCSFGKREAFCTLLLQKLTRCLNKHFFEVSVMITTATAPIMSLRFFHVKRSYFNPSNSANQRSELRD